MIYLQNTTESQEFFVPKNIHLQPAPVIPVRGAGGTIEPVALPEFTLRAENTIDLSVKINRGLDDEGTSRLYYVLQVSLPAGIPDGEYEYTFKHVGKLSVNGMTDNTLLSRGLLIVGESTAPSEYEKTITYEQYETE